MQGIKDTFDSERGVFSILLLVLVTTILFLGRCTSGEWMDYTKWLAVVFISGKTVSHAVETLRPPADPPLPKATTSTTPPGAGGSLTERMTTP